MTSLWMKTCHLVAQMVEKSACNAGDLGLIPGLGRFPGEGNGYPLQYSCLENSTGRGIWWAIIHGPTKSQMWLSKKQNCQEKTQKAGPEFDQESRFSKQLTGNTEDKEHVTECYKDAICKIQAERFYKWPSFLYRSTTSINQLGTVNLNCVKTDANWKQTWSSLFKIRVDFSPPCVSEFLPLSFSHASNLFRLNRPHNLGMFPQGAGNHFLKCKHLGSQPPSSKGMDGGLLASICQKTTSHVKMWDVCFPSR